MAIRRESKILRFSQKWTPEVGKRWRTFPVLDDDGSEKKKKRAREAACKPFKVLKMKS